MISKGDGLRLFALVSLAWMSMAVPAFACTFQTGQAVVLASGSPDPDVFIWDSRPRLVDYSSGNYGDTKSVIAHTMLAKPGTKAVVTSCMAASVRQKYSAEALDAVGIKVVDGPYRGKAGWVTSTDAHATRLDRQRTMPQKRAG